MTPPSLQDALHTGLQAVRAGNPVILIGGDRLPADVLLPAAAADPATIAWIVRHTSGLLCAPMPPGRARALRLPPMTADGESHQSVPAVTVDAAAGITTGISAADRTRTLRVLADPGAVPEDLVRPGHVIPLIAGGTGSGRAESAVGLLGLAGLPEVGVLAELVDARAELLDTPAAVSLAGTLGLRVIDRRALTPSCTDRCPTCRAALAMPRF
ncbi:3,4-dihydroxy-2-butanone-4-phosphate synthase [Pseudonocardia oceani]|uniref:3,4-dihydroxy-2-butanone-4-phosphate synthase n=1 Tax=Pseudonocardia oceani TaxID=2792013 RepID=UPI001C4A0B61|nr:3,4-dihydroxy-2-butanone-4-phosphate synthase [Pseudonocardia oceani]